MTPTRRDFLKIAAISSFSSPTNWACSQESFNDPVAMDKWMRDWMSGNKRPVGTLHLSRFADRMYFTTKPITWQPELEQRTKYEPVTVPVGFVTDFASIPRLLWSLLPPDDIYTYPAIVHDFMYWDQSKPRSVADDTLDFGMQEFNVRPAIRIAITSAVRTFGGVAWNENTRLKATGERRFLNKYPTDPRTTWDDWKSDKNNLK